MTTVMSATENTGNTNAINFDFDIFEPYSMGLFLQALQVAAKRAQGPLSSYIEAPYLLTVDFKGYDDTGKVIPTGEVRHFPIKLINSSLTVDQGGSHYAVQAVAWNETALTDEIQTVKTDVVLNGDNMLTLLQTGAQSLSTVLNERLLDQEDKKQIKTPDQYVFLFPKELASISSLSSEDGAPVSEDEYMQKLYESISGSEDKVPENFDEFIVKSSSQFGKAFKDYANSDYAKNEVGESDIIANPGETGQSPMGQMKYAEELVDNIPIFSRGSAQLQTSSTNRMFKFLKGTRIQDIIEEVLLISTYGQNLATQLSDITDPMGMITWYRIETDVYIVPGSKEVLRSGNTPNIYVYRVVPYKVHSSIFNNPTAPAIGISELKSVAAKEYNYIYTGLNKDILDVDIKYKFAFQAGAIADSGALTASQRKGTANKSSADQTENDYKLSQGGTGNAENGTSQSKQNDAKDSGSSGGGRGTNTTAVRIARDFHEAVVNSNVDLITIEMEIIGDPFFMADSGQGNYSASPAAARGYTSDGSMDYQRSEVEVDVNFRTPIDYNDDGGMTFPQRGTEPV